MSFQTEQELLVDIFEAGLEWELAKQISLKLKVVGCDHPKIMKLEFLSVGSKLIEYEISEPTEYICLNRFIVANKIYGIARCPKCNQIYYTVEDWMRKI